MIETLHSTATVSSLHSVDHTTHSLPSFPLAVVGVLRKSSKLNGPREVEVFILN